MVVNGNFTSPLWKSWLQKLWQLKPYFNNDVNSITFGDGLGRFLEGATLGLGGPIGGGNHTAVAGGAAACRPCGKGGVVLAENIELSGRRTGRARRHRREHRHGQRGGGEPHSASPDRNAPSNARRISAAVSPQPNRAAKLPKRGPWDWPITTS